MPNSMLCFALRSYGNGETARPVSKKISDEAVYIYGPNVITVQSEDYYSNPSSSCRVCGHEAITLTKIISILGTYS